MTNDKILEIARRYGVQSRYIDCIAFTEKEIIAFAQSVIEAELEEAESVAAKHGAAFFREHKDNSILEAIRAKLTGDGDEPVAWIYPSTLERFKFNETFEQSYSIKVSRPGETTVPLYTRPAPARIPLTDEEILDAANSADFKSMVTADDFVFVLARAIERRINGEEE